MLVIEIALAIRVWALYSRSRKVLLFFIFLVGGSVLASLVVFGLGMKVRYDPVFFFSSRSNEIVGRLCGRQRVRQRSVSSTISDNSAPLRYRSTTHRNLLYNGLQRLEL